MGRILKRSSTWQLLSGTLLAEIGVALVGYGKWDSLQTGERAPFCIGGFLVCMFGMLLIWKEPFSAMMVEGEVARGKTTVKLKEIFLGRIELNCYYFDAYEEEAGYGVRRFRLRSFPPISPEREAGFIRYLIHEGLIEQRWPCLSRKIKDEADWAFFF